MRFKDALQKVIDGLSSFYNSQPGDQNKPEYQYYLKMNECKNIQDLIDNMEKQGFDYPNEPLAWWILIFLIDEDPSYKDEYVCPVCGEVTTNKSGTGTCSDCECKGIWIDPAGGVHQETDEFEDPAKMYE